MEVDDRKKMMKLKSEPSIKREKKEKKKVMEMKNKKAQEIGDRVETFC